MNYLHRKTRVLCLFLSMLLVIVGMPSISLCAEKKELRYYSLEEEKTFEVSTDIISSWDKHANVIFTLTNTGTEKIDNWYLTFELPYTIENIWNAVIVDTDGVSTYTIKNDTWNQDVLPMDSVSFSMTLASENESVSKFPEWYLLNTKNIQLDQDKYFVDYQEYSKWDGGFSGALSINVLEYVEDWSIIAESEYEICEISNADISRTLNGEYIISCSDNQNLSPDISLILPIKGVPTENDFAVVNTVLKSETLGIKLNEDENGNGIADYKELLKEKEGTDILVEPSCSPTITEQPTEKVTLTPTIDITGKIEPTVTVIPSISSLPMNTISEMKIFQSDRVLKSQQGDVAVLLTAIVETDSGVDRIFVQKKDSNEKYELVCDDEKTNQFSVEIIVDTDVNDSAMSVCEYECVCLLQNNETLTQDFEVNIINSQDNSYFNSLCTKIYLFDYIDNGSFSDDDYNLRKDNCVSILMNLAQKGIVEESSIYVNETGCTISYQPIGDRIHFIEYSDYQPGYSASGNYSKNINFSTPKDNTLHITSEYDLLIMYGFPELENREGDYNYLSNYFSGEYGEEEFNKLYGEYLNTHIQYSPSIEDYAKGIDNGLITILASHGALVTKDNLSCCCTGIIITPDDNDYSKELEKYPGIELLIKDGTGYVSEICLTHKFFTGCYGKNGLQNTIVILDNCYSAGGSETLLDAMLSSGAIAVTGYTDKITAGYERDFNLNYILNLFLGKTFKEAFDISSKGIEEENSLNEVDVEVKHIIDGIDLNATIFDTKNKPSATPTSTPTPRPTATAKPTPYEHSPIDVWFMCESSDNFGETQIDSYETVLDYIMASGNYFIGRDHIGVGYCTSSGTYHTDYSMEGLEYYKNVISSIRNQYRYGAGNLGKKISPIDWFLSTYWSDENSRVQSSVKYYNNRPSIFNQSNYVFFVDSQTNGYINSKYVEEAIKCLTVNNVRVFFVNLGSGQLSSDMISFAESTGGGELSASPKKLWEELLSYQEG